MGKHPAERMVAISVIVPKAMYETLKAQANEKDTVVAEIVRAILDEQLGIAGQEKVDQKKTLDLIREALCDKDAIAQAVSKALKEYLNIPYVEAVNALQQTTSLP